MGGAFLLLDASDQAITLCWDREPDVSVECVQMKAFTGAAAAAATADGQQQQGGEDEGGSREAGVNEDDWATLSETLGSSALKKNKLAPGTAYVFRRRARKQVGIWSLKTMCIYSYACLVILFFA